MCGSSPDGLFTVSKEFQVQFPEEAQNATLTVDSNISRRASYRLRKYDKL